jgi:nucleotide-binding universal stress UspA family protein
MRGMAAQPRRIVVGFDGSAAAKRALETAADLTGYGSTLTVVTVANAAGADGAALAEARDSLLRRHVTATYVQAVGDPAEELAAAAREREADLVVVGRNGAAVLAAASCDVLVVSERP